LTLCILIPFESNVIFKAAEAVVKMGGTSVLKQSLGKYFNVMAVLDFLLLQITNKSNLT
jgi:hypothetical protein